jgi:hypothetical protein
MSTHAAEASAIYKLHLFRTAAPMFAGVPAILWHASDEQ